MGNFKSFLFETPDYHFVNNPSEEEFNYYRVDAIAFGIIDSTIFYTPKYREMYHPDLAIDIADWILTGDVDNINFLGQLPSKEKIKSQFGELQNDEEIRKLSFVRNKLFSVLGRFWLKHKQGSYGLCSFWNTEREITKKDKELVKMLMKDKHKLNLQKFKFEVLTVPSQRTTHDADTKLLSYKDFFNRKQRKKTKHTKKMEDEITKLKSRAHMIGGRMGKAIRNL